MKWPKLWCLAVFLIVAASACVSSTDSISTTESSRTRVPTPQPVCQQETIDSLQTLHSQLDWPEHLMVEDGTKIGGEFDASEYLTVLSHLSMEPGYALDWVYCYDGMGGYPVLYARPQEQPAYETCSEYSTANSDVSGSDYLEKIQVDGSPEGYFELALLRIMGGQFYLYWHLNYFDTQVFCDRGGLETTVSLLAETDFGRQLDGLDRRKALRLDPQPIVEFGDDEVQVSILTFTKWGGFFRRTLTLSLAYPHKLLDDDREELVPYNCGVMF